MYLNILLAYILGYVNIMVEGYYVERFINICTSKKILLWSLKRKQSTILYANIRIKDFKKIREVARKTKCKIKIENKKGLPFIVHKYKKRKLFLGALIVILTAIIISTNFVWNIEIIGNATIPKEEIEKVIEEGGLKTGKIKSKIDTKGVINKLRLERDDIAWVGIEIKGTNAIIQIVEADKKPEIINEDEYCNIVATKDAIIQKINAQNGTPLVKHGSLVKKGDILIAGWLEGKYTGTRYVHSQGEVQARVWYTNTQKIYLKQVKKEETGLTENKYSVNINNFKINFYKRLSKFEKYDTIEEYKKLKLFSDFYLPFEITKYTNKEYKEVEITYTQEEAKQMGIQKAQEELDSQIENSENILNKQIKSNTNSEYVEVEVTYEVLENIGTKEKIVF